MSFAIGILIGIALTIAAVIAAGADEWVGRDPAQRPPARPPATLRAIRRDRHDRLADISRARRQTEALDAGQARMISAVAKLGDHYEPPDGWQAKVEAIARIPLVDDAHPPWAPQACVEVMACPECRAQPGMRCATDRPLHAARWDAWARAGFPRAKERARG